MRKAAVLFSILLSGILIGILPTAGFAIWQNDSFEFRSFITSVHVENIVGFSTTFNLTDTALLNNTIDCDYVEFYDNDNTTQLNFANIDYLSINGTNCFYKVNQTSDEGFWMLVSNNTSVGTRSSLEGTVLTVIVNETGQFANTMTDIFNGGLTRTQNADNVVINKSGANGGNTTVPIYGNATRMQAIMNIQFGGGSNDDIVIGFNPAGVGAGGQASIFIDLGTQQLQSDVGTTALSPAPAMDTVYFWDVGKNGSAVYADFNGSRTVRQASVSGVAADVGIFQAANADTQVFTWWVENRTLNLTDPFMIPGPVEELSFVIDFEIVADNDTDPITELNLTDYGVIFSFNSTVVANVTNVSMNWNGSVFPITNFTINTSAPRFNSTFNVTNFIVNITAINNTAIAWFWNYTIVYANNTNITTNTSSTQNVLWGLYTNSSVNNTFPADGDDVRLNTSINNNTEVGASATLVFYTWNGTNFSVQAPNFRDFHLPTLTANQTINYTVWFNLTFNGTTLTRNETLAFLNITVFQFDDCSVFGVVILNFTVVWEDNATLTPGDADMQFITTANEKQWNLTYRNLMFFEVCASIGTFNSTVDVDIYYFLKNGTNDIHTRREHYIRSFRVDNVTSNVTLRVNNSANINLNVPVNDESGNPVNDHILIAQKWNQSDNTYYTVTHGFIESGSTVINTTCPWWYRFTVTDNDGNVNITTGKTRVECVTPLDPAIEFGQEGQSVFFNAIEGVSFAIVDNDSNNNTILSIISFSNTDLTVVLNVSKNFVNLCNEETTSTGASVLTCPLGDMLDNIFIIQVFVQDEGEFLQIYYSLLDLTLFDDYGEDALIGSMIVLMIIGLALSFNPIVAVIGLIGVSGLLRFIGILQISLEAWISLAILGIIVIIVATRRQRS